MILHYGSQRICSKYNTEGYLNLVINQLHLVLVLHNLNLRGDVLVIIRSLSHFDILLDVVLSNDWCNLEFTTLAFRTNTDGDGNSDGNDRSRDTHDRSVSEDVWTTGVRDVDGLGQGVDNLGTGKLLTSNSFDQDWDRD